MPKPLLLTSFDVWEPHQISNSSDDLLAIALEQTRLHPTVHSLRKIPVDVQLAPETVISAINQLKPARIMCCGMAEKRSRLTLESNGKFREEVVPTSIDLNSLLKKLSFTHISHDAGTFVCNHLYYSVLKYIQTKNLNSQCLFVHVPILNSTNQNAVLNDFLAIVETLQSA